MTIRNDSVAVITGAASGIGQALAVAFAREGVAGVAVADVDQVGLEATRITVEKLGISVSTHVIDVSDRDQVARLADEVVAKHGKVTHLVNNAGVGLIGTFDQLSLEDYEWLMGINFWGVIYGCKTFLPLLKKEGSAHIINVSSVFGLIGPEEQTAYCSAKFAVRGFTESLRHELAGSNVAVSSVHPGGILTNIVRNSRVGSGTPEEWKQQGTKLFDRIAKTTSETAAQVIIDGIKSNDPRILIGRDAKAISLVSRLFPKRYLSVLEWLNGHKMSLRKKS